MSKLEKRVAHYDTGKIVEGKTDRKTFDTEGLIGINRIYDDGHREPEELPEEVTATPVEEESKEARLARLQFEAQQQFKYDGGDTPEIAALRNSED